MEHCIQSGSAPPRRCPAELMAFTTRGQPEIRQIGRALCRRPTGVRQNSLGLGSWRCTLGALLEYDCNRDLSQIQASFLNSLKFLNSTNMAGPLSKCNVSISPPESAMRSERFLNNLTDVPPVPERVYRFLAGFSSFPSHLG